MPDDLLGTLVAALLTALTTYVALRTKIVRDLEAKYDADSPLRPPTPTPSRRRS